jgi:O-antigen/teichoic acid export membrane protein
MRAGGLLSATAAIGAWALGWVVAALAMIAALALVSPFPLSGARSREVRKWARGTRPFFAYGLAMAAMAQASILALAWLHPSPTAVAAYAAAYATANLALVLVAATNRVYLREMSLLIDRRDPAGLALLYRRRMAWLLPALLVLVAIPLVAPRGVLGLFRPELAAEGAAAMRILAVSHAITMLFSLVPTYLKHRGLHALMFRIVGVAFVIQAVALLALVPPLGATGAALAHALGSVAFVAGVVGVAARRRLRPRDVEA